jgi:hypothetical protein
METFSELDWDFDRVPDSELVACCFWEYARESDFIRGLRRRCLDPKWREMTNSEFWEYCGHDVEKIQSIGYESEVILRGFFFEPVIKYQSVDSELPDYRHADAPPISGSFPHPWQSLSALERSSRSDIRSARAGIHPVPFKRGSRHDARDIAQWADARWNQTFSMFRKVQSDNPGATEEDLAEKGKLPRFSGVQPSLYWEGGTEVTVVAIDWSTFTNDEIATYFRSWVKANRPKHLMSTSGRGHKPNDWRTKLTRLAVMRLLSRFTPLAIVDPRRDSFPAVWGTRQFSRAKWRDVTKWHEARREARKIFHEIFPVLPKDEDPLSWARRAPGK